MEPTAADLPEPIKWFPLDSPARPEQKLALTYIKNSVALGYYDIVIEAPTGAGKSAIGATANYWASSMGRPTEAGVSTTVGGVYLVTQKMLQDQLEADTIRHANFEGDSIKTASDYHCPKYGDCGVGLQAKSTTDSEHATSEERNSKGCPYIGRGDAEERCTYRMAKARYNASIMGITNYAFFLTESIFGKPKPPKDVLIVDECHTLESQLIVFNEMSLSDAILAKLELPLVKMIPRLDTLEDYSDWVKEKLLPIVADRAETKAGAAESTSEHDTKLNKEAMMLSKLRDKLKFFLRQVAENPKNWVYWQERAADDRSGRTSIARPLDAAPYMHHITKAAGIRVYMSAYPGEQDVFCRSLGLDPKAVAWIKLPSSFPVDNRPINISMVGSMSRKNAEVTMPSLLKVVGKIMDKYSDKKGLIHCNSYKTGEEIDQHLAFSDHGERILFPRNAGERAKLFKEHQDSSAPTVLLSPSMTEGFDFHGSLATWQIITKVPFPYLGDKQVAAKMEQDREWYTMQAVMTMIQASGRICRSAVDVGITFILDGDFERLWKENHYMFPDWWVDAMVWQKSKAHLAEIVYSD